MKAYGQEFDVVLEHWETKLGLLQQQEKQDTPVSAGWSELNTCCLPFQKMVAQTLLLQYQTYLLKCPEQMVVLVRLDRQRVRVSFLV